MLKGPEAAALYGIDAANGAIVITTKRGKAGRRFRVQQQLPHREHARQAGDPADVYGPSGSSRPFGATARSRTSALRMRRHDDFYDNIGGFFQTGTTADAQPVVQRRDARRPASTTGSPASIDKQQGVVPELGLQAASTSPARRRRQVNDVAERRPVDGLHLRDQQSAVYKGDDRSAHRPAASGRQTDNATDLPDRRPARGARITALRRGDRSRQSVLQRQQEQDQLEEQPHHRQRRHHVHARSRGATSRRTSAPTPTRIRT